MLRLFNISRAFLSSGVKKTKYSFKYGWSVLPHPQKQDKGGQDAVFVSKQVLVVADGVGGWAQSGIDPGIYSKKLVKIIQQLVNEQSQKYINDPKQLINQAVKRNKQIGSTTVCLFTIHPDTGVVKSYYLGDSVFAIVKQKQSKIQISPDQQIQFNFPVQVGTNGFSPLQGVYRQFKEGEIKNDDYIVMATDGLWDNMDYNLIYAITCGKIDQIQIQTLDQKAQIMALTTRGLYSQQEQFQSPFHIKAKQAGLNYPKQGKPDDTSIIIAQIIQQQL